MPLSKAARAWSCSTTCLLGSSGQYPKTCSSSSVRREMMRWSLASSRSARYPPYIHFAASIVVPDSVSDPLGYYRNNTVNSRALIETAIKSGVRRFIFSSTAAVYGNPTTIPVHEEDPTVPMSPYGSSKLMTEIMLRDADIAHGLPHVTL